MAAVKVSESAPNNNNKQFKINYVVNPGPAVPMAPGVASLQLGSHTEHGHLVLGGRREKSAGREERKVGRGDLIQFCAAFTAHGKISAQIEEQLQATKTFLHFILQHVGNISLASDCSVLGKQTHLAH